MDSAMKEIRIIGQANYCGSSELGISTFSQAAFAGGICVLVDVTLGDQCASGAALSNHDASAMPSGYHTPEINAKNLTRKQLEHVWGRIRAKPEIHFLPCMQQELKANSVESFWTAGECG